MAEQSGPKLGPVARLREKRRLKKERTGDSPERNAQHHAPKRTWGDRVAHSAPGGQRHGNFKGDKR
jgi:hypothetical protein